MQCISIGKARQASHPSWSAGGSNVFWSTTWQPGWYGDLGLWSSVD